MNWITLIPIILQVAEAVPQIQTIIRNNPNDPLNAIAKTLHDTPVAGLLAQIGGQLFPQLSPDQHLAAGATVIGHTADVRQLQTLLNQLAAKGSLQLATPLTVDGIYGPKTRDAVLQVQSKFNLPATGFKTAAEMSLMDQELAKTA